MLFIRFTHKNEDDLARFKYFIHSQKVKFITCLETDANRPHTHTLLFTKKTIDQFRKQLVAKFRHYSGNEDWSIKTVEELDDEIVKVERYVCKGISKVFEKFKNPLIVDYYLYTWDDIELRHKEYWERNDEIKQENILKKNKKMKQENWTQKVVKEFLQEFSEKIKNREFKWDIPSKKEIFDFVLIRYGRCDKGFDASILRKTCNVLWNKLAVKEFTDSMFQQAYPEDAFAYNQYYK